MRIAAILLAAGTGRRFAEATPKQFIALAGIPLIRHAAEALAAQTSPRTCLLQPVGPEAPIAEALAGLLHLPIVPGGQTRQASVRAGLEALAADAPDIVLVHDAARPIIPAGTIPALLAALDRHQGAIPAVPVNDTLKMAADGLILRTVPRQGLYRAQTPQAFRFPLFVSLHRAATTTEATDDAALLEAAGEPVALIEGSEANLKVTYPEDLIRLETTLLTPRIGTGFDVHAFAAGRKLWLCGIEIPHPSGLAGHSDADVGLHALCDAIYGALAEGDIGRHFPPSDARYENADSAAFLRHAADRLAARGARLANADITLICEQPKITPHAPAMIARIAALLAVDPGRISVKATTTERLGFTGRAEGIAAQATVLILC